MPKRTLYGREGDKNMKNGYLSETPNVLLIYIDKELEELHTYFEENGFEGGRVYAGSSLPSCPWYFVNLDNKICAIGRVGVGLAPLYYQHSVTIKEFMKINEIYKSCKNLDDKRIKEIYEKYDGKGLFEF